MGHNWRNASETSIDLDERRYLIWVTQFTPRDCMLGWGREDWNSISPPDLKLFFAMLLKYPMQFATAFYIAINQLSREQLVKRMGLGGLNSIKPAVFLNILRIIAIARNLKEWRDWPIDSVFPKLIHFDGIRRLAIPTDHIKIEEALSSSSQQCLGRNLGYEFNSQPTQTSQVPKTIPTSLNATAIPNLNTIKQSSVRQNPLPNTIAQSYMTQTLPQSPPTHHNHSVHNIPENTTLSMLTP